MIRFFTLTVVALVCFAQMASAQTPEQLKMLEQRGNYVASNRPKGKEPVYYDEQIKDFVIPTDPNPIFVKTPDGVKHKVPMAKTDDEVRATRSGPNLYVLSKMNQEQAKRYGEYLIQDRIFISTSNFEVTTTATGMKYCKMNLNVFNNTPRVLNKIYVTYTWGDVKTSVTFSNVGILGTSTNNAALAGSVCDRVTKGADYTVGTCVMDGLTEDQCRLRIAEL